ncbi:hypothetical protein JZU69_01990, partial [bacterium]|nr:hypothetical protein [bacterium]
LLARTIFAQYRHRESQGRTSTDSEMTGDDVDSAAVDFSSIVIPGEVVSKSDCIFEPLKFH